MSMTPMDGMRAQVSSMLVGIDRYNPENINTLERYLDLQCREHGYDLEANLTLLKLYQFNPTNLNMSYVVKVLLKALTNLPNSDFVSCKSLLSHEILDEGSIKAIQFLADLLEGCRFKEFWSKVHSMGELTKGVAGFEDSVRKFVCHVISITYQHIPEETLCELLGLVDENVVNQWIAKNGWKSVESGHVLVTSQDEQIKTKKITEKIDMESVAGIMASCF